MKFPPPTLCRQREEGGGRGTPVRLYLTMSVSETPGLLHLEVQCLDDNWVGSFPSWSPRRWMLGTWDPFSGREGDIIRGKGELPLELLGTECPNHIPTSLDTSRRDPPRDPVDESRSLSHLQLLTVSVPGGPRDVWLVYPLRTGSLLSTSSTGGALRPRARRPGLPDHDVDSKRSRKI